MKEQLISFNTAKLAKEKGFNIETIGFWHENAGGIDLNYRSNATHDNFYYHENSYYAPTQSLLQKWLREEHDIHILVDRVHRDKVYWYGVSNSEKSWETSIENSNVHEYNSYEEALEAGLVEGLKLIKT